MRVGGRLLRILFVMTIVFTVWTYSISAAEEKQPEKNGDIVILYTSDVHCAVDQGFGYAGLQQVRDYKVQRRLFQRSGRESQFSKRNIRSPLFPPLFHRCSAAAAGNLLRNKIRNPWDSLPVGSFLWHGLCNEFSPLRRTRAGRGQRAAGPPLPYCTWCDEKKRDRGLRVCARVCSAFLFLFHEID